MGFIKQKGIEKRQIGQMKKQFSIPFHSFSPTIYEITLCINSIDRIDIQFMI